MPKRRMTIKPLPTGQELFLPKEAAPLLGISVPTCYRRIQDGTIPTYTPFKPYKIHRETIEALRQ